MERNPFLEDSRWDMHHFSGARPHFWGAIPFSQRSVMQVSMVLHCRVLRGYGWLFHRLSVHRLLIFSPGLTTLARPLPTFLCTWILHGLSLRAQRANLSRFSSVAPVCGDLRMRFPSHCWVHHLSSWLLFTDFVELSHPWCLLFSLPSLINTFLCYLQLIIHWGLVMIPRQQVNGCVWCSIFIHR